MTKRDLAKIVAKKTNKHVAFVVDVIDTMFEEMAVVLQRGESVTFPKVGRFERVCTKQREYTMPGGRRGFTKHKASLKFYSSPVTDREMSKKLGL